VIGGEAERLWRRSPNPALRASGFRVEYPMKELAIREAVQGRRDSGETRADLRGGERTGEGRGQLRDLTERTERDVPRGQIAATVRDFLSGP